MMRNKDYFWLEVIPCQIKKKNENSLRNDG